MRDKLPPLFTLQAFEAASRLNSFSRAARELHLTPGAVSRQIRQLEDWCALTLFERKGPKLSLTEAGTALLTRLCGPLAALHQAVYPAAADVVETLHIAILGSTAKEWLIPRLHTFSAAHPEIGLLIQTDYALLRPAPRVAMVAIRHGARHATELACETLFEDMLVAVAAPALLETLGRDAQQWPARAILRHVTMETRGWMAAAGLGQGFTPQGMAFNDADVMLEAASCGLGVALTRLSIAWRRLEAGSLVLASDVLCASARDNLVLVREDCADMRAVRVFLAWLREQAGLWMAVQAQFAARAAARMA
ncbi:LysR substrate-binding domain-containing protein [Janthinobacterium sp.]|uniref:LysR substrate-binding domain-containing protein n=1 Tax=Janthinobacterium sp. TaxID=1871054 RepID=UPI00293D922B|nr:LysR substrate-binding domain-containing protein [Janthinobacterium sp.]